MRSNLRPRLAVAVSALVLGAVLPFATAAHAEAASTCSVSRSDQAIDGEEEKLLQLINQYRSANRRNALVFRSTNTRAAAWLSRDMATNNYFSHTDSNGRGMASRLAWCGVTYTSAAENIAAGYSTAEAVFGAWKASSGHNTNMLRTGVSAAGIARVPGGSSSKYKWYWTLVVTN